jgi:glycosyltransferase involved in cell wall biosynthesis
MPSASMAAVSNPNAVTVLMPFRNAAAYLDAAIRSIQAQTHRDWRLLAVDDASEDNGAELVRSLAQDDSRIELHSFSEKGFAAALNQGLELARTEYVARMDADDLMLPRRLELQLDFARQNPDVVVAGGFVYYVNEKGRRIGSGKSPFISREKVAEEVRAGELIGFHHPTALLKRETVLKFGGYRKNAWPVEDVDLWTRLAEQGHVILIQSEYLLEYRVHALSGSRTMERLERVEWLKENKRRRDSGRVELGWGEYRELAARQPLPARLTRWRKLRAKFHYKEAATLYARGYRAGAAARIALSSVFSPGYAFKQLRNRRPGQAG